MTTIVVKRVKNKIILASDTRVTGGSYIVTDNFVKIFKVSDDLGFGGAGIIKTVKYLQMYASTLKIKKFRNEFALLDFFDNFLTFQEKYNRDSDTDKSDSAQFIFVSDKKIYVIGAEDFYEVNEPYYAIGSGDHFALGALSMGATPEQAVKAAMAHDTITGGRVMQLEFNG